MKTAKDLCSKAAIKLNLPAKYVWEVYNSYWKAIREYLSELPLKDTNIEELKTLNTSLNISSLGKFFVDFESIKKKRNKYERLRNKKI